MTDVVEEMVEVDVFEGVVLPCFDFAILTKDITIKEEEGNKMVGTMKMMGMVGDTSSSVLCPNVLFIFQCILLIPLDKDFSLEKLSSTTVKSK